jgi:hypothetical protein
MQSWCLYSREADRLKYGKNYKGTNGQTVVCTAIGRSITGEESSFDWYLNSIF